ncbi:hypothetical protein [Kaistella jeonii]|uniref:Uncharacterized protein n=1 Tax=Kaistella jeonii TaxID=266749 RepID=A0A0C1FDJ9_9FLAO|nr:hypothetical protein [Kaistella jeonii]KIA89903.1 hypothetical protein OA86_04630 [Kaistella jeonii]SFB81462.1 hypothetical protein SAMN05421876_102370 [Kaistella jeonii]VEI96146.1 Uncharacterised protein [Kaistella jeonii]
MRAYIIVCILSISAQFYAQKTLQLYGGKNEAVYLGCLNCNNVSSNSIWNEVGNYGSPVSSTSIWNEVGTYGGPVSSYSPFNPVGNNPPKIIDSDGNFYGYLTANPVKSNRATFKLALTICENWEYIKKDVGNWYYKIFR